MNWDTALLALCVAWTGLMTAGLIWLAYDAKNAPLIDDEEKWK